MSEKRKFLKNVLIAAIPASMAGRLAANTSQDEGQNQILALAVAGIERLKRLAAANGEAGLLKIGSVASSKVAAYLSTDQLILTNSPTVVRFDNKEADTLGEYKPETGQFKALHSGLYQVSYGLRIENAMPAVQSIANLRKNGKADTWIDAASANQSIRGNHFLNASGILSLNQGDVLDILFTHFHDSSKHIRGRLSVTRIL